MTSTRVLRLCMLVLVLLNLVLVELTGAAGRAWIAPLFVLALSAPLLKRFREHFLYRFLWNGGVVCVFCVLVRHAVQAHLAYVLQDGLVLAVLCQVHLLNNLRSSQRPDVLFFNAFLIATVTGYMTRGVGFLLVFLLFAPAFVVGLQLLDVERGGGADARTTRRLVLDAGVRAAGLLVAGLLVFAFWPRDFERRAYFHEAFERAQTGATQHHVGFSEDLRLTRKERTRITDEEVVRVTLLEGRDADVPTHWRGATQAWTNGGAWRAMGRAVETEAGAADPPWEVERGRLVRAEQEPADELRMEVVRVQASTDRLFTPLGARSVALTSERSRMRLRPLGDGSIEGPLGADLKYVLTWAPSAAELGGAIPEELPEELVPYVQLPDSDRVRRAREIAERLAGQLPEDAQQEDLVALVRTHLERHYTYLPPGAEGAATTLDQFLRRSAGAHCEFFASALATMLRSRGVPCRVVTGFRSSRWDARARVRTLCADDAHAWVEVYDPEGGWYTVDPSPRSATGLAGPSAWDRMEELAGAAWERVTSFDAESRAELFRTLKSTLAGLGRRAVRRPWEPAAVLGLLVLTIALWRRWRSRAVPRVVRAYAAAVRSARVRPQPGETPRELLARARAEGLETERLRCLEAATREHERERYAA